MIQRSNHMFAICRDVIFKIAIALAMLWIFSVMRITNWIQSFVFDNGPSVFMITYNKGLDGCN